MRTYNENTELERIREESVLFEQGWTDLCEQRGEYRYVELFDRHRRCYGRVFIPSEVMFVWNKTSWIPANDRDSYGNWEPVVSIR